MNLPSARLRLQVLNRSRGTIIEVRKITLIMTPSWRPSSTSAAAQYAMDR